jgi:hypothetical protein
MYWPKLHKGIPFSGLAGLVLMNLFAFTRADLYGYDMAGTSVFTGLEGMSRSADRWRRERKLFERWRRGLGLDLNIIGASDAEDQNHMEPQRTEEAE